MAIILSDENGCIFLHDPSIVYTRSLTTSHEVANASRYPFENPRACPNGCHLGSSTSLDILSNMFVSNPIKINTM